ncbi:kininogen-1 isoform X1 [Protopterus annectens]|uniref:kininogen-1 isoform X1 n=1 Tax=Protopterus annectens TaxID=7888 RepID=UPI001CFADF5D|nr:kininogen-1 isoform X1 [Protopterus annectens]
MKALIVLLFSFQFIPHCSEAALQNVACDNKEVFDAVDQAIQQLNEEKTTGNKFILHRILDAYINLKNETGTQYLVKFEIQEGNCSVGSKIAWTSCNIYISELIVNGICASEVFLDNTVRSKHVVTQTCTTKQVGPCHGCPISVDNNNPILEEPLRIAINAFNSNSSSPFLYGVVQIKTATSQVTAGLNYKIELTMQETNCTKATMETWTKDCPFKEYAPMLHCKTSVFIVSYENRTEVDISCKKTLVTFISGLTPFRSSPLHDPLMERQAEHLLTASGKHSNHHSYGHSVLPRDSRHSSDQSKHKPKDRPEQKPPRYNHHNQESAEEKHTSVHGQHLPHPPTLKPNLHHVQLKSKLVLGTPEPPLTFDLPEETQSSNHEGLPQSPHQTVADCQQPAKEQPSNSISTPSLPDLSFDLADALSPFPEEHLPHKEQTPDTPTLPDLAFDLFDAVLPFPDEHLPDIPEESSSQNCPGNPWIPMP